MIATALAVVMWLIGLAVMLWNSRNVRIRWPWFTGFALVLGGVWIVLQQAAG